MTEARCPAHVTVDWGSPDDPGPSATFQCERYLAHEGHHRSSIGETWAPGETHTYRETVSSMPMPKQTPLDLDWARRCAQDFADKPTEARARNAAQCLAGLLAALDTLQSAYSALAGGWVAPPEPCREVSPKDLECFLVAGHPGDHSANVYHREPATWPRAATAPCTADGWHRPGVDPCPARSHRQESCLKGYLHMGGHEWGGTKTIVAGPDLGTLVDGSADPDQRPANCRCTVGIEPPDEPKHRCPRCGSTSWVSVSLDEGWTRRAQCVPCGCVHALLGGGWRAEAAARPTGDATEPRTGAPE